MTYREKLESKKVNYPFGEWRELYDSGLDQYTEENCDRATLILDILIDSLTYLGEDAPATTKVELFRVAVESLNTLNDENHGTLIESGERDELCELFDSIAIAAGLNPVEYGGGEGIASEWRNW
jgi:hypothetical protein